MKMRIHENPEGSIRLAAAPIYADAGILAYRKSGNDRAFLETLIVGNGIDILQMIFAAYALNKIGRKTAARYVDRVADALKTWAREIQKENGEFDVIGFSESAAVSATIKD